MNWRWPAHKLPPSTSTCWRTRQYPGRDSDLSDNALDRLLRLRRNEPGRGHERLRKRHERSSIDRLAEAALAQVQAAGGCANAPPVESLLDRRSGFAVCRSDGRGYASRNSLEFCASENQSDPLTGAFVSDLSALLEKYQPSLCVHGHVHNSSDYRIGRSRIVCNPHGYGQEDYPTSTVTWWWRSARDTNFDPTSLLPRFRVPSCRPEYVSMLTHLFRFLDPAHITPDLGQRLGHARG